MSRQEESGEAGWLKLSDCRGRKEIRDGGLQTHKAHKKIVKCVYAQILYLSPSTSVIKVLLRLLISMPTNTSTRNYASKALETISASSNTWRTRKIKTKLVLVDYSTEIFSKRRAIFHK